MENNQDLGKDGELLDYIYSLKSSRENYEPISYIARKAYDGRHFVYWNRTSKQLQELPIQQTNLNQIPELSKQVDGFENFLLSQDFIFTTIPTFLSEDQAVHDSMMLSVLSKNYYESLSEMSVFSDWVHNALLDNVSFLEVTPTNNKKDVTVRSWDFFDILFDPTIKEWADQTIVIKVIKKTKEQLKNSKLYHLPAGYSPIGADFFSWKDIYMNEKYSSFVTLKSNETLIFEAHILSEDGLRVKAIDGAKNVLRNDHYPNIHKMDIIPLRIYSGDWYQQSYAYRLIPINRTIDLINSRMEALILRLAKGGYYLQEEEDINGSMNEEMGQIIRYATTKPEAIQIGNVPPWLASWFQNLLQLSERYGLSSILTGGMPVKSSGLRANKMLDSIKQLASETNTSIINNYRNAVKQVLEVIFMYLYELWDTPQDVIFSDFESKAPRFVSQKSKQIYTDKEVIGIPNNFKKFTVEIDNALGYSLDEKKKTALQLYGIKDESGKPIISSQTLKKIFKLGASGYLLEAEEKPMYDTQEFQKMIQEFPNLNPQEQQAFITTLESIAKQQGNQQIGNPQDIINKLKAQGGSGGAKPPQAAAAPPVAPTQPVQAQTPLPQGGGM